MADPEGHQIYNLFSQIKDSSLLNYTHTIFVIKFHSISKLR